LRLKTKSWRPKTESWSWSELDGRLIGRSWRLWLESVRKSKPR
jgi:hypothetical protein